MSVTLKGTAGLVWGCTSETGGLVQSVTVNNAVKTKTVANHEGETVGKSMYDRSETIEVVIYYTAASGLGGADPAETLTVASYTPAAGLVLCDSVRIELNNEDYKKLTISATCYPLITS